jgi:hypothetical protein
MKFGSAGGAAHSSDVKSTDMKKRKVDVGGKASRETASAAPAACGVVSNENEATNYEQ